MTHRPHVCDSRLALCASALLAALLAACLPGCIAPSDKLRFPAAPLIQSATERRYDVDGDGKTDFHLIAGADGRFDTLGYDDDEDGTPDRIYHLRHYDPSRVPHLIVLLDSIPFEAVRERYARDGWTWFDPPQKVIPPFPTMSPVIFSRIVGAPPMPGAINQYYDRRAGAAVDRVGARVGGSTNAWERRVHYRLRYWENGLAFLAPRRWLEVDLARAAAALDSSPDRVTLVYLASTACMLSSHGEQGLSECLDGFERLCLQVLHDRRGAVKISAMADHGHNLRPGVRIDAAKILSSAGIHVTARLREPGDAVVEQDGLVNFVGVHTGLPARVADAMTARQEFELAMYLDGNRVIVQSASGRAAIECRGDRLRYTPLDADVLDYAGVLRSFADSARADSDGFVSSQDWFDATVDHRWPDVPARLWEAFHGIVVNTPDVLATTRAGYYVGLASYDWFVDMASTHGGLDQIDSATFLLTMTGRAKGPMRSGEVLRIVEPEYTPSALRR